jgi:hypothetical protein
MAAGEKADEEPVEEMLLAHEGYVNGATEPGDLLATRLEPLFGGRDGVQILHADSSLARHKRNLNARILWTFCWKSRFAPAPIRRRRARLAFPGV